jgi:hypothetical protein
MVYTIVKLANSRLNPHKLGDICAYCGYHISPMSAIHTPTTIPLILSTTLFITHSAQYPSTPCSWSKFCPIFSFCSPVLCVGRLSPSIHKVHFCSCGTFAMMTSVAQDSIPHLPTSLPLRHSTPCPFVF